MRLLAYAAAAVASTTNALEWTDIQDTLRSLDYVALAENVLDYDIYGSPLANIHLPKNRREVRETILAPNKTRRVPDLSAHHRKLATDAHFEIHD